MPNGEGRATLTDRAARPRLENHRAGRRPATLRGRRPKEAPRLRPVDRPQDL